MKPPQVSDRTAHFLTDVFIQTMLLLIVLFYFYTGRLHLGCHQSQGGGE